MRGPAQRSRERAPAKSLAVVQELLQDYRPRDFAVELWDGTLLPADPRQFCRFTWRINNPGALRAALRSDRQVALAEAYVSGDFDISGDILAIFPLAEHLAEKHWSAKEKLRLGAFLLGLPATGHHEALIADLTGRSHSKLRDRQAVTFHYDVSNEFYKLWLQHGMGLFVAYFLKRDETLV